MNLRPYSEYKPSGVKWWDSIPAHWNVETLNRLAHIQPSNVDKHTKPGETPVRLCNYTDVYKRTFIHDQIDFMKATATPGEIDKFTLREGDVIITKDSETWTDIAVPAYVVGELENVLCGYHLTHIRPYAGVVGEYIFRAFQALPVAYQFWVAAKGVTRYGIDTYSVKSSLFPLPPPDEQAAIVTFLDAAEKRIRRYIRVKQKLIKLLNEQKQAIIQQAVTRGLDPDVPMKDSGVEWLGEIPAHWEVETLNRLAYIQPSNVDKHTKLDEIPVRLCNYTDVYKRTFIHNQIEFMKATATQAEIDKFALKKGDVIITKDSETWNDIAVPAYVIEELEGVLCGYHLTHIRPYKGVIGEYIFRAFQAQSIAYQFWISANGVTRYAIDTYSVKSSRFTLPPPGEQKAIVEFLDNELSGIDSVIKNIQNQIDLIHEYRACLIADVVTGKVDVRGLAFEMPEAFDESDLLEVDEDDLLEEDALEEVFDE